MTLQLQNDLPDLKMARSILGTWEKHHVDDVYDAIYALKDFSIDPKDHDLANTTLARLTAVLEDPRPSALTEIFRLTCVILAGIVAAHYALLFLLRTIP